MLFADDYLAFGRVGCGLRGTAWWTLAAQQVDVSLARALVGGVE